MMTFQRKKERFLNDRDNENETKREREGRGEERKRARERYVWMRVNPTTQAEEPVR